MENVKKNYSEKIEKTLAVIQRRFEYCQSRQSQPCDSRQDQRRILRCSNTAEKSGQYFRSRSENTDDFPLSMCPA